MTRHDARFGASRGQLWLVSLLYLAALSILSLVLPPMKSPDEQDHLRRAYILSQGRILLESVDCAPEGPLCKNGKTLSGGMVDQEFAKYLALREQWLSERRRESEQDRALVESMRWSGATAFAHAPGTAFYLPVVYMPQAVALAIGKASGMRIERTYHLARWFSILAVLGILLLACRVYRLPAMFAALLLVPGFLTQVSSTTIDGISTAVAVLAVACFLRLVKDEQDTGAGLFFLMLTAVLVVSTSRVHLLPMLVLPFVLSFLRKRWSWAVLSVTCTVLSVGWTLFAMRTAVDFRNYRETSVTDIAMFYAENPVALARVLWSTITDGSVLQYYFVSLVGGVFSSAISWSLYLWLTILLLIIVALSVVVRSDAVKGELAARSALLVAGVGGVFMTFLALLLAWTVHPATQIQGVQGRYFLVPLLLMFCSLVSWRQAGYSARILTILTAILAAISVLATVRAALVAYYIPWMALNQPAMGSLAPSPLLSPDHDVKLNFQDLAGQGSAQPVDRIGISLATYQGYPQGAARLMLTDSMGRHHHVDFDLANARDNRYLYFTVPARHYVSGVLKVLSGRGGVSVWEYHDAMHGEGGIGDYWRSCMVLQRVDGSREMVSGCYSP